MWKFTRSFFIALFLLALTFITDSAFAIDQDVVFLRKDCSGVNSGQTCFTNLADLQTWLWGTRNPTSSSRVVVHIGPGDFNQGTGVAFTCPDGKGYVSLIGSGPETTRLTSISANVIIATNCTDLHVEDLSIVDTGTYAIRWHGDGSSRWVNVDVVGTIDAWLDSPADCVGHPIHYWFSSKLRHLGNVSSMATYDTGCGESWFYGSELTYLVQNGTNSSVVQLHGNAEVRAFGTVIRAIVPDGYNPGRSGDWVYGVKLLDNSKFHIHGGIISLDVSPLTSNVGVSGIEADDNGFAHTPDTAFNLKPAGSGQVYRTYLYTSTATILSPFLWPSGPNPPPLVLDPQSSNGADLFVQTNCSSGGCQSSGTEPHMLIYSNNCTGSGGPWFDVVTRACR